jgi:hypothetical protein
MIERPEWILGDASSSIQKWAQFLYLEAKKMFNQDGTHGSVLFSFSRDEGIVSVNPIPPNTNKDQVDAAIVNAVGEHNLYGVVLIGEAWMYFVKDKKDHTAFQLLDGETNIADLNVEDKKEALMVRMENQDGDSLMYLNEIVRDESGPALKEDIARNNLPKKWFLFH